MGEPGDRAPNEAENIKCRLRIICLSLILLALTMAAIAAYLFVPVLLESEEGPLLRIEDKAPAQPAAPTTQLQTDGTVLITWAEPQYSRWPLRASDYSVFIKTHSDSWDTDVTHCNGFNNQIAKYTKCSIPIATLMEEPFELAHMEQIEAKV